MKKQDTLEWKCMELLFKNQKEDAIDLLHQDIQLDRMKATMVLDYLEVGDCLPLRQEMRATPHEPVPEILSPPLSVSPQLQSTPFLASSGMESALSALAVMEPTAMLRMLILGLFVFACSIGMLFYLL